MGLSSGQEKWWARLVCLLAWLTLLHRCNKNYKKDSSIVPPGGQSPIPTTSDSTLLVLRCTPIYKPYVAEDVTSNAGFIVDTLVTHTQVRGAKPIALRPAVESLLFSISIGPNVLAVGRVPVNTTKAEIPFFLTKPIPREEPYTVSCSALYSGDQKYTTTASLPYPPNPPSGSITKLDSRIGRLWTKPFSVEHAADYTPAFPLVFRSV
jgi:hypothetical protein